MTILYLDTEFNGHGGELLSLALACPSGKHFYMRLPDPVTWDPWVKEHVVPHFEIQPTQPDVFRWALRDYLLKRGQVTIVADWPADFMYLLQEMCGPHYGVSWMVDLAMVLIKDSDPKPLKPHNALSDAIALMEWRCKETVPA